ncbi:MAG: hypothetical protein HIU93_07385 [Acidobacteria bacterium]|nr:hypothetical protein [Acidobacteriota bacterium]MBW4046199.1 hypothetical protein [Acidobacteriota bacterium]
MSKLLDELEAHVPRGPRLRHLWHVALGMLLAVIAIGGALFWYATTASFANHVRRYLIATLEQSTGGRVELGAFHWQLLHLQVEADNLTIHGLEASGEVPYAHLDRLLVRAKILSFLRPKIDLEYLEADRPVIHLIIYPDGSTNQPQPKIATSSKPLKDTIFDLAIKRTAVNDGILLLNQRAIPFNVAANNVTATVTYSAPQGHYLAQVNASDISAQRGSRVPVHSQLVLTADAGRNSLELTSLRFTSGKSRLDASATVKDFNNPSWKFRAKGAVDLREANALADVNGLEAGTVQLDLEGRGVRANMNVNGTFAAEGATYRTDIIHFSGINARSALHLTPGVILLDGLQVDFGHGGALNGAIKVTNWKQSTAAPPQRGSIRLNVKDLPLDTILAIVAPAQFQRIGFDTAATGTANAQWVGDLNSLTTDAKVTMAPDGRAYRGEVPLSGAVDATYSQRNGMVDVRHLEAHTPGMTLNVNGALGVYPLDRQSTLQAHLRTTNLAEFDDVFAALGGSRKRAIPIDMHGAAQFDGVATGSLIAPEARGHLTVDNFDVLTNDIASAAGAETATSLQPVHIDSIDAQAAYTPELLTISRITVLQGKAELHAAGVLRAHRISPKSTSFDRHSVLNATANIDHASLTDLVALTGRAIPVTGTLNLEARLSGALDSLQGGGQLNVKGGEAYGEPYHSLTANLNVAGHEVGVTNLLLRQNSGQVTGAGDYNLTSKQFRFSAQGKGFELVQFNRLKNLRYPVEGALSFNVQGSGTPAAPQLRAEAHLARLVIAGAARGNVDAEAHTQGRQVLLTMNANLDAAHLQLSGQASLDGENQAQARLVMTELNPEPFLRAFNVSGITSPSPLKGTIDINGPLRQPRQMNGEIQVSPIAVVLSGVTLKTDGALHAVLSNGVLSLDPLHVSGDDTDLRAQGRIGLFDKMHRLSAQGDGSLNVKLAQTINSNVTSSGHIDFHVRANGTTVRPFLTGQVNFKDVNFALNTFPNGISKLNGTLEFDQDRLQVKTLTGKTGGGLVTIAGFITYQQGIFGDLTATGQEIRIRYPAGISSMVDTKLRLQGTSENMLLSGNVELTRFVISPNLDFASLASGSNGIAPPPNPSAFSNRVRLDVHVTSSPELDFQNSLAHLAGDVDLHVRGSVAQPSILGRISVTEGSATFAGTKYQLQHGDIYFTNPVRIEPVIDLDATTHVEDYEITIGLHGTTSKLSPTFRSEPPLSEQDIFSLLAMGRTQQEQQIYSQAQQQAGVNSTADALLGGAINATLSSRIQKLFGGGSVKIDPTFISGLGTATARITVQQQVSKNATLTYATNVNSTQEQLIQGEVQVTPSFSIVAVRDEVGVFSLIFKLHRRYH